MTSSFYVSILRSACVRCLWCMRMVFCLWMHGLFVHPFVHDLNEFADVGFMQWIVTALNLLHRYGSEDRLKWDAAQPLVIGKRPSRPVCRRFFRIECWRIGRLLYIQLPQTVPEQFTAGAAGDITGIPLAELIGHTGVHEVLCRLPDGDMAGVDCVVKHVAKIHLRVRDIEV